MAGKEDRTEGEHSPGFLHSLKVALAAVSSALHTRLELFVTELEEERERLKQARRVDIEMPPLGMLCILGCLPLSIREVPHYSAVGELQRPSQNRTCRFPTSGSSATLTSPVIKCRGCDISSAWESGSIQGTG